MNLRATNKSAFILGHVHAVLAITGSGIAEHYYLSEGLAAFALIILAAFMLITGWIWILGMFNISEQITSGTFIKSRFSEFLKTG